MHIPILGSDEDKAKELAAYFDKVLPEIIKGAFLAGYNSPTYVGCNHEKHVAEQVTKYTKSINK